MTRFGYLLYALDAGYREVDKAHVMINIGTLYLVYLGSAATSPILTAAWPNNPFEVASQLGPVLDCSTCMADLDIQ